MMRKCIFLLLACLCVTMHAQQRMSLDAVQTKWMTKNIKVNGGASPGILTLVTAFQQTWPTYTGGELLKFSKSKVKYENTDKVVDLKNGFVSYMEDDPDAVSDEAMSACVWRRHNGHSLFAITFNRVTPSELVVLCFYDYDPKTQTLVPEKSLSKLFTPSFPGYRYRVELPQHGKNMKVYEYFGAITLEHTYAWDGMKPVTPQVTLDQLYMCQGTFNQDYFTPGDNPFTQYAMVDIDHDGIPELLLQSDDGECMAAYATRLTIDLLGGQNGSRFLSFYKNAVCNSGSCGALCMSSNYVILKESSKKTYFNDLQEWDNEKEDYGDSAFTLDGKKISSSEGEKILRSLGQPIELNPKWKALKVE